MSIAKKILGNTFAQIIGKLTTAVIALVTVNILSRYFSVSEFADYGTIYEYLAIFGAIADMGIYTLVLREMSRPQNNASFLYGTGSALRVVLTLFSMVIAIGVAFFIPAYAGTNIPTGVIIGAIGTFFILMSGTVSVVLQYALKMRFYAYSMIAGKLITFFGVLAITQYFYPHINGMHEGGDAPFYWILFLGLLGSFGIMFFTFLFSQKEIPLHLNFDVKKLKELWKLALPFGISMILITFYFRMGFLFLRWLLPDSENDICSSAFCGDIESAKYIVSLRMMEVLLYFPIFFMNSLLPFLSQTIAKKSEHKTQNILADEKTKQVFSLSFLFLFIMAFPMAIGGYILATPLSGMLAADHLLATLEHAGSDTAFQLLSIAIFFGFINIFSSFSLIALNKQKKVLIINAFIVFIGVIINIILIPMMGLKGAALSTVITEIILSILLFFQLQKENSFPIPWKEIMKIIIAGSIMAIVLFFSQGFLLQFFGKYLSVLVLFSLAAILFFGMLYIMKFFTSEIKSFIAKQ